MKRWHSAVDLAGPGKQVGDVRFPAGPVGDPDDEIAVPLTVIANGAGPTIVLTAGVHGDEYEGQIALSELARKLSPQEVTGRIIILPALNTPACLAGQRFCPLDDLNLNRIFPGDIDGSFTRQLASFVETELYGVADFAVDIHGGGALLHFLSATIIVVTEDEAENRQRLELATAFGATHCMLFGSETMGVEVGIDGAMVRHGVIGISGEYGGSAQVGREPLALCRAGVRRVLASFRLMADGEQSVPPASPLLIDVRREHCYATAPSAGVFEPLVALGDAVRRSDTIGLLHQPTLSGAVQTPIHAGTDGIVMARRGPARTETGDWMFIVGEPVDGITTSKT